MAIYIYIYYMT